MPTFMIPFNGKIVGMIRGRKKTLDHHFRGGNGTPEPFTTQDEDSVEILRQNKMLWEIDAEEKPAPVPEPPLPSVTHVGAVTTHADQPEIPPDHPEEVDQDPAEVAKEAAKMAKQDAHELQIAQLMEQLKAKRAEPDGYKKSVKPYVEQYEINAKGKRREDVDREIAEARIAETQEGAAAE